MPKFCRLGLTRYNLVNHERTLDLTKIIKSLFFHCRGRISSVSSGGVNKAKNAVQSKIVKKNKIKQLRQLKCDQILEGKKAMSSGATPPILVVLIPLVPFESTMVQQINSLLGN